MVYENVSNLMHTFYEEKTASENVSFFLGIVPFMIIQLYAVFVSAAVISR